MPAVKEMAATKTVLLFNLRNKVHDKKSQDCIYRTGNSMTSAAFCNEGYESLHEANNLPSQLIIHEQDSSSSSASSLSIAPRWNRSTFANSDEVPVESTRL